MRKLYSILAAALLMSAISVNAQNRCTVGDKNHGHMFEASENALIKKHNDHAVSILTPIGQTTGQKAIADDETGVVRFDPVGDFDMMWVLKDNDPNFNEWIFQGDEYVREFPVGKYYVMYQSSMATEEDWWSCYCIYDFELTADADTVVLRCDGKDAKYSVNAVDCVDENGNDLALQPVDTFSFHLDLNINLAGLLSIQGSTMSDIYYPHALYKVNDLGDYCTITTDMYFTTMDQTIYMVAFPAQLGAHEDIVLTNKAEEMVKHEEYYHLNNQDSLAYYSMGLYDFSGGGYGLSTSWSSNRIYDDSKPYTVVMNCIDNGEPCTGINPKYKVIPMIYDSFDMYGGWNWPRYDDLFSPIALALDTECRVFYEPFSIFQNVTVTPATTPDLLVETPARCYIDEEVHYGERTPMVYQRAQVNKDKPEIYGVDGYVIFAPVGFTGENGLERIGDTKESVRLMANGEEMFNDSAYLFNGYFYNFEEPAVVEIIVKDANIEHDSIAKVNVTNIRIDLNNEEDMVPPTFTILQVLDQNGKENTVITNLDFAQINLAAGEWNEYYDEEWNYYVDYVEGTTVEAFYNINAADEWLPLELNEQEDMFHINYGKFYSIPMAQLDEIDNVWVSLKIVATDAAGNSQEQVLTNLFYVDIAYGVEENTVASHTVYPNPFSSEVRIIANEAVNGAAQVSVNNILGEQVYVKSINCSETTEFVIDGSNFTSGVYFYGITTENGTLQGRIVKE